MKNIGAYMDKLNHMIIKDIPMADPGPDDVLIRVEYVGICGSDVHYFHDGRCGSFVLGDEEFMLGHECAGTIVRTGERVCDLKVGDRVCIEPGITCGQCEFCKSGHYNLCPDVRFLATPPIQGCYERYLVFPANMCFKLPDNVSTRAGALIEPLAIGMYAAELGGATVGQTVVILGGGCIGLMTLMACKACGVSKAIVCDLEQTRLDKALELGADIVINGRMQDAVAEIMRLTDGRGADVVYETAGSQATIRQTPFAVRRGGLIVLVGMAAEEEIPFNFGQIMAKQVEIKSLFRYVNMFGKSVSAVASGLIPVEKVVTHEFDLKDIQKAFEESIYNKANVVKAVIRIPDENA